MASTCTDGRFTSFTYNWTVKVKSGELDVSEPVYSDPFEIDNLGWQAIYVQCVGGITKYGLKFLGCSVFGPFYMKQEFHVITDGYSSKPTVREFHATSCEHYEWTPINPKLKCDGNILRITFKIKTSKVANFIIPPSQLMRELDPNIKNCVLTEVQLRLSCLEPMKAHKEILAARSPVFAAMFNSNMSEKQKNEVVIRDMSHHVLSELINYIYTDKANFPRTMGFELMAAADKYDLPRLKAACERAIFRSISVETAIDTLILADKHNANQLKTHTLRFIGTNADDVLKTSKWRTLIDQDSQLVLKVYQAMAKK